MKLYITIYNDDGSNIMRTISGVTKDTNLETIIPIIEDMVDTISNPITL